MPQFILDTKKYGSNGNKNRIRLKRKLKVSEVRRQIKKIRFYD